MNGYLLDTNVVLLASFRSASLSAEARAAVLAGPHFLSSIVYWEVMLKSMKGKLDVGDPRLWWLDAIDQLAATALSVRSKHIAGVYDLPPIHQDPFDRVLIAQAIVEDLTLVTTDAAIPKYASERFQVIQ